MKVKTLIQRYRNLGYTPKGFDRDLEIDCIIKWLYETHKVWVDVTYITMAISGYEHTARKFIGAYRFNTGAKDFTDNRFTCDEYFENPYDAKFDAVKHLYKGLKFRYNIGIK